MAARYTEVTLEDMERFLKRAFRSLRPRKGVERGETFYDLRMSDNAAIRVWTSIKGGGAVGAGKGKDAIRVQIVTRKGLFSKAPIVKRTQNWRTSLQNRIDDAMDKYEEGENYWEGTPKEKVQERPPGPDGVVGPPPSDKQVYLIKRLIPESPDFDWSRFGLRTVPDEVEIRSFSSKSISKIIDALKVAAPDDSPATAMATFRKLRSGQWGIQGKGLVEGNTVTVVKRSGQKSVMTVGRIVWTAPDGTVIAEIAKSGRRYAGEDEGDDDGDDGEGVESYYYGESPS